MKRRLLACREVARRAEPGDIKKKIPGRNLLAIRSRAESSRIEIFILPRNSHINRAHGTDSHVASLEIASERIQTSGISYRTVWDMIASCQDVESRRADNLIIRIN